MIKAFLLSFLGKTALQVLGDERKKELIKNDNDPAEIDEIAGKGKSVRLIAFAVFVLPFVVSVILPSWGAPMWENIKAMPGWYVELFIAINATVWGLGELKPILPGLVRSVKDAIRGR